MAGLGELSTWRDAIIQGLAGRRALLSSGWAALADTDLPDTVHPIGWAPHDWIFPRCAAIVHHCGAGTTHQAAQSGTPSIPVPFGMDPVSYTHLRAHETRHDLVCRLLLE